MAAPDQSRGVRRLIERCVIEPRLLRSFPDDGRGGDQPRHGESRSAGRNSISLSCPTCGQHWELLFDIAHFFWNEICSAGAAAGARNRRSCAHLRLDGARDSESAGATPANLPGDAGGMSHFLARLVERARGTAPRVEPVVAPRFASNTDRGDRVRGGSSAGRTGRSAADVWRRVIVAAVRSGRKRLRPKS